MNVGITRGAYAGLLATFPMTGAMVAMNHAFHSNARALPPEKVADGVAKKLEVDHAMSRSGKETFTWVSHFGFGAAAGALYAAVMPSTEKKPIQKGIAFGLGVWAVSYAGWIPAFHIMRSPIEQTRRQVSLQVLAHVVWGACLGFLARKG